jgi:2-succinyl-5-enolpyruvyl-6-hydroxy-3-cyclohexene-1-carboxylate synthase
VVERLQARLPAGSALFCGGSMAIRDADNFLAAAAKPLRIHGNRGVSGIDGHVATVAGLAAAGSGPVAALLGDLALYHDMNGLLHLRGRDVVLVVVNNGGGGIFEYLPQARLPEMERLWLTPTGLDLARVAGLYGLGFRRVTGGADLEAELDAALDAALGGGPWLLEVVVERTASVAAHRAYWERARPPSRLLDACRSP